MEPGETVKDRGLGEQTDPAERRTMTVKVPEALDGQRLDRTVALLAGTTRAEAARLVDRGSVQVDGAAVRQRRRLLRGGQVLEVAPAARSGTSPVPDRSVQFRIVYEDPYLVVVDKPAGLVVHHGAGHHGGTLVDGLLARYPELAELPARGAGEPDRPGIVHRLDKDTSGLLVVARDVASFHALSAQMRSHEARRIYTALVHGLVPGGGGVIDAPVGRSTRSPTRMAVSVSGRPARTSFEVSATFAHPVQSSLLDISLETGRTHQVRVHLAAIGHPVVGDRRYGRPADVVVDRCELGATRQFLHARELTVTDIGGVVRSFSSSLPSDLTAVLEHLGS
jgi:23S rRNA pseudouridine1911/1915/1917 synthase